MLLAFPGRVKPSTTPPDDDSDLAVLLHLNPVLRAGAEPTRPTAQPDRVGPATGQQEGPI